MTSWNNFRLISVRAVALMFWFSMIRNTLQQVLANEGAIVLRPLRSVKRKQTPESIAAAETGLSFVTEQSTIESDAGQLTCFD